ncbi:MAG: PIG-L family deacetylase [Chloroflexota bacterium]
MQTFYDTIYLSPHLDDVALSCGGQIVQQATAGKRVLIVTIMAGDPPSAQVSAYAQSLQERWELLTDAAAGRRAEDLAACAILGADALHWDVPDCIYRYHPDTHDPFYVSDDDIFGDIHPIELNRGETLVQQIQSLPRCGRMIAPLTLGHHVDHLLTRQAAEQCFGANLLYYEDYPYAQEPGQLENLIPAGSTAWQCQKIALNEAHLQTKIDAIYAFQSQLSTFFVDRDDLEQQVRSYTDAVGGERLWEQVWTK